MTEMVLNESYKVANGTHYHRDTPNEVIFHLERARQKHLRVRLYLGDPTTGRDWMEDHDVRGTIGRSMGPVKAPLLIRNAGCLGGFAILTHCVVRIKIGNNEVWRHKLYNQPVMATRKGGDPEYPIEVTADGEKVAGFKNMERAQRYLNGVQ